MPENSPGLETGRLILRRFTERDAPALYALHSDREVNRFLPMLPLESMEAAEKFLREQYLEFYEKSGGFRYAVCLKTDGLAVGYVHVAGDNSHDLGYGLKRELWNRGIITEAARAVAEQARSAGLPYITATHDICNPASGAVMRGLGMTYRYTYEELWRPKDILVRFRMYQLDLNGRQETYRKYWDQYPVHYIEEGLAAGPEERIKHGTKEDRQDQ